MEVKIVQSDKNRSFLEIYINKEFWKRVWKSLFQKKLGEIKSDADFYKRFAEAERKVAYHYSLTLLAKRALTEKQLRERLRRKEISQEAIDYVIDSQLERYIDCDIARRAEALFQRGKGPLWIQMKLQEIFGERGEVIRKQIDEVISEEDFVQMGKSLLKKKFKGLGESCNRQKAYRFLLSRGFSPSQVQQAMQSFIAF